MATYLVWKNNVISMVRGDTLKFKLTLIKDEENNLLGFINKNFKEEEYDKIYHVQPGDSVYFGLMAPNKPFEKSCVVKYLTIIEDSEASEFEYHGITINEDGSMCIKLDPNDTEFLYSGEYFYTVKVELANDEVETVVPNTKLLIID